MPLSAPDWLMKHGGSLRQASDGESWVVYFAQQPQYRLKSIPVKGQHGCEVEQMNNGKRLESGNAFATRDEALQGGLEDLRKKLGW